MATMMVMHHKVQDFDAWKPVFDGREESRREHHVKKHRISRSLEDPTELAVTMEFDSTDEAKAFLDDPSLNGAMDQAGVEGKPEVQLLEKVEYRSY